MCVRVCVDVNVCVCARACVSVCVYARTCPCVLLYKKFGIQRVRGFRVQMHFDLMLGNIHTSLYIATIPPTCRQTEDTQACRHTVMQSCKHAVTKTGREARIPAGRQACIHADGHAVNSTHPS